MPRAGTSVVEVTLLATRADGSSVEDLKPKEIRVFDNGKKQTIATFEMPEGSAVYHRITLRTTRRGVHLRYRPGYDAPRSPVPTPASK